MSSWAGAAPPFLTAEGTAEEKFLVTLRRRVSWQSDTAARLRNPAPPPELSPFVNLRDVATVAALVASRPGDPRAAEWQDFIADLRVLADADGKLHEDYEPLVRAVLADLLP